MYQADTISSWFPRMVSMACELIYKKTAISDTMHVATAIACACLSMMAMT